MAIFAMAQNGTFAFCATRRVTGRGSATTEPAPCASLTSAAIIVGLHKRKGDRKAHWAMSVHGPWRICFRFARGDAHDVEIVDYHKG